MERLPYQGWQDCYQIESGDCRMIATADVGPRVVHLSKGNGINLLKLFEAQVGKTGGDQWRVYGGHRVWYAPEDLVDSYIPDNLPVRTEVISPKEVVFKVCLKPEVEKTLIMRVANKGKGFELVNQVRNLGGEVLRTASWGITSLAPGGVGFMPLSKASTPEETLCASGRLNTWDYTDFSDPAYVWRSGWVELHQPRAQSKQKVGTFLSMPWLAYRLENNLVIKTFDFLRASMSAADFPDQGSNVEVYFDPFLLELEGLSPWADLEPGESVSHIERLHILSIDPVWSNEKVIELVKDSITSVS